MIIVLIPTQNSEDNSSNKQVDSRTRLLVIELLKKDAIKKKGVYISTTGVYGNKMETRRTRQVDAFQQIIGL